MTSPIRIVDDVSLFLLDDEGVFFCGATQELHRFNTAATWVWCALEEGLATREIIAGFARAFAVSDEEAKGAVAAVLHQWQGLGHIEGVDLPSPVEVDLVTALGRVLTRPALREAFAHSPEQLARRLSLRAADREPFLSLDPQSLERQAELLASKKAASRRMRQAFEAPRTALGRTGPAASPITRCYRLVGTTFALRFDPRGPVERVHAALAHLAVSDTAEPEVVCEIRREGDGHLFLVDGEPVGRCGSDRELAPLVKGELRRLSINRQPYFMELHAGAVLVGEACLLLPGGPGSGKSTLTAELIHCGMRYLSDETALLVGEDLGVRPVPLGLCVKPGSVALLSHRYPELSAEPTSAHRRQDGKVVRYVSPPEGARLRDSDQSYRAAWLVFPRVSPERPTELRRIARADALQRLMGECLSLPEFLDRKCAARLVHWMRGLQCFELEMSSLEDAAHLVRRLVA